MEPISLPFQTLQRRQANAKLSGSEVPPCFRLTMWSTWWGKYASSSDNRQYSQQPWARSATRRRSASPTSLANSEVLPCPGLCQNHDVLELHIIFEFGVLLDGKTPIPGALHQFADSCLSGGRRVKGQYCLRSGPPGDEVDDFFVRSRCSHGLHHLSSAPVEPATRGTLSIPLERALIDRDRIDRDGRSFLSCWSADAAVIAGGIGQIPRDS
jgi:hypothetical protein